MIKEIEKAVETFHRIAFGTKNGLKLGENKLAAFITVLTNLLITRYENNWYPENPDRGSGYRCIRVNCQCIDPTIMESLKRAKISVPKSLLRTELTIWVDPGVVSVRIGEDGSIGSEIVDEEICNLGKKGKEFSDKTAGSDSDEGFISRTPSPDMSASEHSGSPSPSLTRCSTPTKSPTPSTIEYNPYLPPAHLSRSQYYQQSSPSHTPSLLAPKSLSPPANNYLLSSADRSHGRSTIPAMSSSPQGEIISQAHIPVSSRTSYTRPRTLFPSEENVRGSRGAVEGFGKMTINPYSMAMSYGGNIHQANFYDIPAMA